MGYKDLKLGQIVYILVFYNISFSWLLALDGLQFIFLLRDIENEARPGLFREWLKTMVSKILAWPSQINKKANIHNIHEGCMLDKQYSLRKHPFLVFHRSSSLGTFRAEERRSSVANSGEKRMFSQATNSTAKKHFRNSVLVVTSCMSSLLERVTWFWISVFLFVC